MILDIEDVAVRAVAQGIFLAAAVAAQALGPQIVALGMVAASEEFAAMQNDPGGLAAMAVMVEAAMIEAASPLRPRKPRPKLKLVP